MNTEHVISVLKSALIVDASWKNELIMDAIKLIDPVECDKMNKEFDEMLEDISRNK
jgi:hypothetical protein